MLGTKATGLITWHMVRVSSTMPTGTSTMESGSKIKPMATAFTNTKMGRFIWANGLTTCNMVRVKSHGLTKVNSKGITSTERSMGRVNTFGLMEAIIAENGIKIRSKEWALTLGMMVGCTWVNGKTTTCMAGDVIRGRTVGLTRVNIWMIRSTAWGFTHGLMGGGTKAIGKKVSSTARELISSQGNRQRLEFGMRGLG